MAVGMADRDPERVGRVRARQAGQLEQARDHVLHLGLDRLAGPDHGLLDLGRRVFRDLEVGRDQRADGGPARRAEQQGRLWIHVDEDAFDGRAGRLVGRDDLADAGQDHFQARRQRPLGTGLDGAGRDVAQALALLFDDAEARRAQARVDAENNHWRMLYRRGGFVGKILCKNTGKWQTYHACRVDVAGEAACRPRAQPADTYSRAGQRPLHAWTAELSTLPGPPTISDGNAASQCKA